MKIYALKSKKRNCLMSFSHSSNEDGDFCGDCSCELSSAIDNESRLWLSQNFKVATNIAEKPDTKWYNSDYEHPMWNIEYYGKLEVVCMNEL